VAPQLIKEVHIDLKVTAIGIEGVVNGGKARMFEVVVNRGGDLRPGTIYGTQLASPTLDWPVR
jgi:hypothetical protein